MTMHLRSHLIRYRAICAVALAVVAVGASEAQRVRVAAISMVPVKLDLAGNVTQLEAAFRQAAAGGAKLAVAPEGVLDGYVINQMLKGEISVERMREVAIPMDGAIIARFRALAKELALCLVFGFAERVGRDVFNTAVFIDDTGRIRGKYHKMQFEEGYHPDWWFNRLGTASRAFDTPFGRCGILICNDRWNPVLAKIPALDGAQFLVVPAYGSTSRAQDTAMLERARETGLPIVEANVGVSLIVNGGAITAQKRERTAITFGEIVIPSARPSNRAERDATEQQFLRWRDEEMRRRFEQKRHRLGTPELPIALPKD